MVWRWFGDGLVVVGRSTLRHARGLREGGRVNPPSREIRNEERSGSLCFTRSPEGTADSIEFSLAGGAPLFPVLELGVWLLAWVSCYVLSDSGLHAKLRRVIFAVHCKKQIALQTFSQPRNFVKN